MTEMRSQNMNIDWSYVVKVMQLVYITSKTLKFYCGTLNTKLEKTAGSGTL